MFQSDQSSESPEIGCLPPEKYNSYHAFGLRIAAPFALPELGQPDRDAPASGAGHDLVIRLGTVPDVLPTVAGKGVLYQAAPGRFLFRLHNIGSFLVKDGQEIVASLAPGVTPRDMRVFLLGSVLGAALHMRDILPLHASAVVVDGKAVLFAGHSGAGKSTLAGLLGRNGRPVIADDLCAVSRTPTGEFQAWPGCTHLKLWADALNILGLEKTAYDRVRDSLSKFGVPLCDAQAAHASLPIGTIYVLTSEKEKHLDLRTLAGTEKIRTLQAHVYRPRFQRPFGVESQKFAMILDLARRTRVPAVCRPENADLAGELAKLIEADL